MAFNRADAFLTQLNDSNTPPAPPPKPLRLESSTSPNGTLPPAYEAFNREGSTQILRASQLPNPPFLEEQWLPPSLFNKSKTDLTDMLSKPPLLAALLSNADTSHPSVLAFHSVLGNALDQNASLAQHLIDLSQTLVSLRASSESHLLQLHALERQWRLKQGAVDDALAPWSPKAIYARLVAGIAEQEAHCSALEESFLEEEGKAGDREMGDFVKRYREGRKLLALRKERKARFDEGRVGGWR